MKDAKQSRPAFCLLQSYQSKHIVSLVAGSHLLLLFIGDSSSFAETGF